MMGLRDRKLGVAEPHGRYDLPFHKDQGTDFLLMLMALMTFLAVILLAGALALSGMSARWSSGLEDIITVEIAAETAPGTLRAPAAMEDLMSSVVIDLRNQAIVESATVLKKEEISTLLQPWLGEKALIDTLPLPGIITVKLKEADTKAIDSLKSAIEAKGDGIRVETQDAWLVDLLRLTGALRGAALFIVFIIGITTFLLVAGAVRARMAIHKADVELLHLIGADDLYIMRQFQKHTLMLSLKGALAGLVCGGVVLGLVTIIAGPGADGTLPQLSLSVSHLMVIMLTPAIVCIIAALTARFTVLRSLAEMP